jgi:hypothetical protein
MALRGLSCVILVALVAAGCGGASAPPKSAAIHLDGKRAQGDYVFETDASGLRFLLPATVLAGQGSQAFDVAAPGRVTVGEPPKEIVGPGGPYQAGVASATAVVPRAAHVEVLATGDPGRRFALSWEETCGWTQEGKAAVGGTGGQGMEVLRSPAVTMVKLPRINTGVPSCYVAANASTTSFTTRMRLAIIDY